MSEMDGMSEMGEKNARAVFIRSLLRAWPLLLLLPIGWLMWSQQQTSQRAENNAETVVCPSLTTGCRVQLDGREFILSIRGSTKPLTPFQVRLQAVASAEVAPAEVATVEVRFIMEGMDMGFNLYTLQPDQQSGAGQNNTLTANVTLPICVTGRRDWKMMLQIDKQMSNTQLSVPFVTDL